MRFTGETPVPASEIASVEFDALLVTVKAPEVEPLAVGANVTVICLDWLAARVKGVVMLLIENPVPVAFAEETVIDVDPEFVIVTA